MRFPFLRIVLTLSLFALMIGCASENAPDQPQTQADTEDDGPPGQATEIIFKGRYHLSKECRTMSKGELALGLWPVCEVEEVLQGKLRLTLLKDIGIPDNAIEGVQYMFRWNIPANWEKSIRKAEAGGYHGMWFYQWVKLEIIEPENAVPPKRDKD